MSEFKKGDKITCVDRGGNFYLSVGSSYLVEQVKPNRVYLRTHGDNENGTWYTADLFKLAPVEKQPEGPVNSVKLGDPSVLRMNPGLHVDGTAGVKYDQDKPDMSLLSSIAMVEVAKVMTFGKKKYAAHNWRGGFAWSRPLAAGLRHVFAFLGGQDNDPETGLSHLAHAICCFMFVLEFVFTKAGSDDRYKTEELKNASNQ